MQKRTKTYKKQEREKAKSYFVWYGFVEFVKGAGSKNALISTHFKMLSVFRVCDGLWLCLTSFGFPFPEVYHAWGVGFVALI